MGPVTRSLRLANELRPKSELIVSLSFFRRLELLWEEKPVGPFLYETGKGITRLAIADTNIATIPGGDTSPPPGIERGEPPRRTLSALVGPTYLPDRRGKYVSLQTSLPTSLP